MRVLDIGTMAVDLGPPGAELVDYNVFDEDDPDKKIKLDWVGKGDSLVGPYDMIMMTWALRYNADKLGDGDDWGYIEPKFVDRLWELTKKGSWIEIVDWLGDYEGIISPEGYRKRFIEPLIAKGFECVIEMAHREKEENGRVFYRLQR